MNLHQILQELRIFLSSQDKRFPNEDVFASKFRLKEKSGPEPSRVCDNHFKHRDVVQKKTFEILTIRKSKMSKKRVAKTIGIYFKAREARQLVKSDVHVVQ